MKRPATHGAAEFYKEFSCADKARSQWKAMTFFERYHVPLPKPHKLSEKDLNSVLEGRMVTSLDYSDLEARIIDLALMNTRVKKTLVTGRRVGMRSVYEMMQHFPTTKGSAPWDSTPLSSVRTSLIAQTEE